MLTIRFRLGLQYTLIKPTYFCELDRVTIAIDSFACFDDRVSTTTFLRDLLSSCRRLLVSPDNQKAYKAAG